MDTATSPSRRPRTPSPARAIGSPRPPRNRVRLSLAAAAHPAPVGRATRALRWGRRHVGVLARPAGIEGALAPAVDGLREPGLGRVAGADHPGWEPAGGGPVRHAELVRDRPA